MKTYVFAPLVAAAMALACPLTAHADGADKPPAAPADASTDLPSICTDRPTKSNVPCTVDAGHWQYETDLFNGTFLSVDGATTDTYLVINPTLKYGLTKTLDVEVNIAPYEIVHTKNNTGSHDLEGIGDLYLKLKDNFYESADGKTSIAVIPYVKAPTARMGIGNGAVEGGVILPVSHKLTEALTFTTVPEADVLKDSTGDGHHFNTAQLVNLAYSLPDNVTVYSELWGDWNFDPAGTVRQYSADVAVAWGISKYFQIDGGVNFGLNRATPGIQAYVGLSQKF